MARRRPTHGWLNGLHLFWKSYFKDPLQPHRYLNLLVDSTYSDFSKQFTWEFSLINDCIPSWVYEELISRGVAFSRRQAEEGKLDRNEIDRRKNNFSKGVLFIALLKACTKEKNLNRGASIHAYLREKRLFGNNPYLGSSLISMYAKCGALEKAQEVLRELPVRDVVSWSSLIAGYAQQGHGQKALDCFEDMLREGVDPDLVTYVSALKACGSIGVEAISRGEQIHKDIVSQGMLGRSTILGTALVNMYAKCGKLGMAQQVLEELPVHDVVSWNALISGYVQQGQGIEALKCLEQMQCEGFLPDVITFVCALKACGITQALDEGKRIHDEIFCNGLLEKHIVIGNALVDMYAKCGALKKSQEAFDKLPIQDVVSWNALIAGYTQQGHDEIALSCFQQMQSNGFSPNPVTFICILKACGNIGAVDTGKQVHHEIVCRKYLGKHVELGNALVDMYARCGELGKAQEVFDELSVRDTVSWNTLISGYSQHGQADKAMSCFEMMKCDSLSPNAVTFICLLKACADTRSLCFGQQVHNEISTRNLIGKFLSLDTALLYMYVKCGEIEKACQILEDIPLWDVAFWNALIAGYSQQGYGQEALIFFEKMHQAGFSPNTITFISVLKACGITGAVDKGIEIHNDVVTKRLLENSLELGNALVDMYAKCGDLEKARKTFDELLVRDVISWNTLISGYSEHGLADKAINCFKQMQLDGIDPDAVTFLCVLNACSHSGLAKEGKLYFRDMSKRYGMIPDIQHYTCMVDLFSRVGHLDEAIMFTNEVPSSDYPLWCALLGACQKWDNVKFGTLAFEQAIQLDDTHGAAYFHMANIYATLGMQEEMP